MKKYVLILFIMALFSSACSTYTCPTYTNTPDKDEVKEMKS